MVYYKSDSYRFFCSRIGVCFFLPEDVSFVECGGVLGYRLSLGNLSRGRGLACYGWDWWSIDGDPIVNGENPFKGSITCAG